MAQRVFLHVGLPKSGTTYLQAVLGRNREPLKQVGVLYPGQRWGHQVDAVRDLRGMRVPQSQRADVDGAWARLVAEVDAWPRDAVISMEWLCAATPPQIDRAVTSFQGAELHVVVAARDLARTVPAAWQEFSQNRATWRWPDFLEQVTGDDPMRTRPGRAFWSQQDLELLLPRWSAAVPVDRIHLVTLPQSGADPAELWRRMAHVLGIQSEGYDLSQPGTNASLGMESAELMRRVNERARAEKVPFVAYNRLLKHRLAKGILAARSAEESKVLLPVAYHDWVRERAEQQIRAVEEAGVRVVGDLDELRPRLDRPAPSQAVEPDPEDVLEAAVHALVAVALDQRPTGSGRGRGKSPAGGRARRRSRALLHRGAVPALAAAAVRRARRLVKDRHAT